MAVIARQLGHADDRMTQRHYAHLAPNYVANTIRAHFPTLGIVEPSKVRAIRYRVSSSPSSLPSPNPAFMIPSDGHEINWPSPSRAAELTEQLGAEPVRTGYGAFRARRRGHASTLPVRHAACYVIASRGVASRADDLTH
jgi:hypothetical protein